MDVIEELATLQKQIYKKCGDLYEAIEVLGKPLYDEMLQNYHDTYKKLYEILSLKFNAEYEYNKYYYTLKKNLQTPKQCGFLWLFKNEAKKLAIREANAEIRSQFNLRWEAVEALEETLLETKEAEPDDKQPEPPVAEEPKPGTATPANGSTHEPVAIAQPSEPSNAAQGASDATLQSDEKAKKPAEDVAGPPATAPTSEEPKPKQKPKAKPKKVTKPATEPPAPTAHTAPAPQLSGQIAMDELAGNK